MGVVYRAFDPELGREVAIKFLGFASGMRERGRQRFQREARVVARLDHPHIVRVYDIGQRDGYDYFVMRLVRGPSLARRLERGPIPQDEAIRIALQVAGALHHAHQEGLVHRDVKPGNILLDEGHVPVLTDFGVVKDLSDSSSQLTVDSRLIGTPAYMAPEQLRSEGEVGPAADQYALGVVLYEMLTGSRPARSSSPGSLAIAAPGEAGEAGRPGEGTRSQGGRRSIPGGLERVLRKALAEEPDDRYSSMEALAGDLERYLRGEPVLARPPGWLRRMRLWVRARPGYVASAAVVAILLGVAAFGGFSSWLELENAARLENSAGDRLRATETRIAALTQRGRAAEADAAFTAFTAMADNHHTRALARGWLNQAERLKARQDNGGEGHALAQAYVSATDDRESGDALLGWRGSYAGSGPGTRWRS